MDDETHPILVLQCLAEPLKPQYGGGIISNPGLNHGLSGWSVFGEAKIQHRSSEKGNSFIVAHSRKNPLGSFSQKVYLLKDRLYTFSAWVQVDEGNEPVTAVFSTNGGMIHAGAVHAESGCWSMLKGGLTVNSSGPAELYFKCKNTTVEIWVDSISLQPFTEKQWRTHQDQSVEKARKKKVRFQAVDAEGKIFAGARISIQQKKASFPFGCAIDKNILNNSEYHSWLFSRFSVTTFGNEMKWYSTETSPGKEDYSIPDAMLSLVKQNGISVRGHNIFWDDPQFQPSWVKSLSPDQLRNATARRINSVVSRYKGQLIAWDVVNENLHFSFFEDKLGNTASAEFYQRAHELDGSTPLFMNEFNTIEESGDGSATPAKYLQKLREIMSEKTGPIGIGLESHFRIPNIPYVRSSLDFFAAAKLPIWITELDVESNPSQAQFLEQLLREFHSHPAINGIIIWSGYSPTEDCYRMCLIDKNFKNLPTGDVVDKLINEWTSRNLVGSTDSNGTFGISLFHGDYDVKLTHPSMNSTLTRSFEVTSGDSGASEDTMLHEFHLNTCLADPLKPQYGGGIISNPELNHGLNGWSEFGQAKIEHRSSEKGNSFIVAHSRKNPFGSFSQKVYLLKGRLYTFSAWVQVDEGNEPVTAVFGTNGGMIHAGAVHAESGCWSMLKGGLTVNSSGPAELYFECKNTTVEIWVDSISLQPFTEKQWRTHQDQNVEKARKKKVTFQAVDAEGKKFAGAKVSIQQEKASFPFGCAITNYILTNPAYKDWFVSRFSVTTFANEMKWYSTETSPGKEDYSVPDAMLSLVKQNGISVRGHNVFWDEPKSQPNWVPSLSPDQLRQAAAKRIDSVMSRYKGQLIAWDVVNENLHNSFFEDKLGKDTSTSFYQRAHQLDSGTTLFLNEYNTIEDSRDGKSTPANYLQKLREIQSQQTGQIGIGLESHFKIPNIPYMRASLDVLAAANVPIWITELDVESNPSQAQYLEAILREAHAHPAINGIILWADWRPQGCYKMCLTDNNFSNLPTGDVVDKLINEWKPKGNIVGLTDSNGTFEVSLFHGDYDVKLTHPSMNSTLSRSFKVTTGDSEETMDHVFHLNTVHDV
ncbi:hypothetical protein NE237_010794 [Protea cynaroides]|uniref:GH10 domain-containing protein n=1 Tax=Protea cynaroides TaxID=273540 RepID=A0A9Q0L0E1_9MAGN|nr:hypothetical protein NE237_010794 [Protea cynaroides]